MTEGAHKRLGFSAIGGRKAKAKKIAAILSAAGRPLNPTIEVLDLGCGSGEVAEYLAGYASVRCADAEDQRTRGLDLPFHTASAVLPFADASFDVVLSNHVIEHTLDPAEHLNEIRRILKPDGVAYLATPNRLWPWEPHARLPFLHYLPWRLFSRIGMVLERLHEPVRLLTSRQIRHAAHGQFALEVWHHRILRNPERYALKLPAWAKRTVLAMPDRLLNLTASMQPTLILLLTPK